MIVTTAFTTIVSKNCISYDKSAKQDTM